MKNFLVQVKVYGYTQIQADSWEDACEKADELHTSAFDLSGDTDIDVINEVDDNGCAIDEEQTD